MWSLRVSIADCARLRASRPESRALLQRPAIRRFVTDDEGRVLSFQLRHSYLHLPIPSATKQSRPGDRCRQGARAVPAASRPGTWSAHLKSGHRGRQTWRTGRSARWATKLASIQISLIVRTSLASLKQASADRRERDHDCRIITTAGSHLLCTSGPLSSIISTRAPTRRIPATSISRLQSSPPAPMRVLQAKDFVEPRPNAITCW
jgi:hypothetical protein